jgi:hypothetical protein
MKITSIKALITIFATIHCANLYSADPVQLESRFDLEEVKWIQNKGNSSISGKAFLQLNKNEKKGCASFGVELLPVAKYSNERIFKTYGNNSQGQVLLKDNPPKFTPDHPKYHELVIKTVCDEKNAFTFNDLPAGDYYVIAFIIWKDEKGQDDGGAVMKKLSLGGGEDKTIDLML